MNGLRCTEPVEEKTKVIEEEHRPRIPFAPFNIKVEVPVHEEVRAKVVPEKVVDWSMKSAVTITSKADLSGFRTWLAHSYTKFTLNHSIQESLDSWEDISGNLTYWRFPFPSISQEQQRKIAALINSKANAKAPKSGNGRAALQKQAQDQEELAYFQNILGSWRKAFLSLYSELKSNSEAYFFYFQQDFGALFRTGKDGDHEAILCQCTEGIKNILKTEGIHFEELSSSSPSDSDEEPIIPVLTSDVNEAAVLLEADAHQSSDSEEDQENRDPYIL